MSIDFKLRDFCYPVDLIRLRRQFDRSQWFSPEEFDVYQQQRLEQIVQQAYHHVPYYHDLFRDLSLRPEDIRTANDLRKLPTLSKATLRREYSRLQATNRGQFEPRLASTSGSSGEPLRFLLDKPSRVLEFVYYWRHWSWLGYRLGDRFAELSSNFFVTDASRVNEICHHQALTGRLLLNSLSIGPHNINQYAAAFLKYRPRFLKGIASALYHLSLFLQQAGAEGIALKGIFSTGEMLLPHQRRVIESVFNCQVLDSYGHMERTVAVSECRSGGLHINPEYGVVQLEELPTRDGPSDFGSRVATVIGTSLHNFSMPLLRYEVGDVVELAENASLCACGRSMPRVSRINGRQEDVIVAPDGSVITTLFIVFDKVPGVAHGQIIQEDCNTLRLRVVRNSSYDSNSEATLLRLVRRFVGPQMQIRLEYLRHDEMHTTGAAKFRTVISRIKETNKATSFPEQLLAKVRN